MTQLLRQNLRNINQYMFKPERPDYWVDYIEDELKE